MKPGVNTPGYWGIILSENPKKMGIVGILGGMGPLATVDFMSKLIAHTPAKKDQDHIPVLVSSIPQVPDRTLAFRGEGDSPLNAMLENANRLAAAGAQGVVITCNTAHLWFDEIQKSIKLPMIHIVDAAIEKAIEKVGENPVLGLLATDATLASGLYINREVKNLLGKRIQVRWLLPTATEMNEFVMPGILAVKAGKISEGEQLLARAGNCLKQRGANALVLGCTEIPIVLTGESLGLPLIDATDALAEKSVAWSMSYGLTKQSQ